MPSIVFEMFVATFDTEEQVTAFLDELGKLCEHHDKDGDSITFRYETED